MVDGTWCTVDEVITSTLMARILPEGWNRVCVKMSGKYGVRSYLHVDEGTSKPYYDTTRRVFVMYT